MIIQMNATVCAGKDHGGNGQDKIAGSDLVTRCEDRKEGYRDQEKQKIKGNVVDRWFFRR